MSDLLFGRIQDQSLLDSLQSDQTLNISTQTTMAKASNNRTVRRLHRQNAFGKNERASRDGRKQATKGGKGGKVQSDGTSHRSMGYLAEEHYLRSNVSKSTDFAAVYDSDSDFDSDA